MIKIASKFGDFIVAYKTVADDCADAIMVVKASINALPLPISLEVENRVLRLALYDLKMGYQKLEDL